MTVWFENINLYQMLKSTNIISHFLLKTSVIVYYKNHVQLHYLFTEFMVNSIMQIINEFWFADLQTLFWCVMLTVGVNLLVSWIYAGLMYIA